MSLSKFDPLLGRMRTVDQGHTTIEKHFSGGGGGSEGTTLHSGLTDVSADQHHTESHTLASHSTRPHSALTGIGTDDHHAQSHAIDSHTGTLDHGALGGLTDDDHTQYSLVDGTRVFTGDVGIGSGITPAYDLDIRSSPGSTASQVHVAASDVDSGGYLTNTVASDIYLSGGAAFNGTAWIAKDTSAAILGSTAGNLRGYANSGLTAGNSFTVTERFRFTSTQFIVNTGAFDFDTNLRGDNDANAFYLDASTDSIGLGTATPDSKLEINHDISALHGLTIQTTNNTFTNGGPFSFRIQTSSAVNRALMNNYGQASFNYASAATGNAATISNAGSIRTLQGTNNSLTADPGVQIAAIYAGTDKNYVSNQQATALHTQFRVNNSGSTDNGLNAAAYYFAEIQGSSVVANLYAQYNHARNSSSGTSTNMTAVNVLMDFPAASTGAVTNAYGFRINVGGGAGTKPANALGLDILDVTGGTSTNFAIRTNAGNVVFNEGGDASTDFRVEGDTNTHLLFTDANVDRVGINVSAPAAKLHIDQSSTTGAIPVITVDQADVSEEFVRFIGTSANATLTQSIVEAADVATFTPVGYLKIYVQDDGNQVTDGVYYMQFGNIA